VRVGDRPCSRSVHRWCPWLVCRIWGRCRAFATWRGRCGRTSKRALWGCLYRLQTWRISFARWGGLIWGSCKWKGGVGRDRGRLACVRLSSGWHWRLFCGFRGTCLLQLSHQGVATIPWLSVDSYWNLNNDCYIYIWLLLGRLVFGKFGKEGN
jgi:hypothetical protein